MVKNTSLLWCCEAWRCTSAVHCSDTTFVYALYNRAEIAQIYAYEHQRIRKK